MKNSIANVQKRRNQIETAVNTAGSLSVKEIAAQFGISEITCRRDLKELARMGKVSWRHGLVETVDSDTSAYSSHSGIDKIKDAIAAAVPSYITENSTLFVNSSSLCWRAINQLAILPLTIITNNIHATECVRHRETSIILTGGEVHYPKESLVGTVPVQLLQTMQSDYTLIGCDGITADGGVSTQNIYEAQVNSEMIAHTKQKVICVADYRKVGIESNYHVSDLDKVSILITDGFANEKVIRTFREKGVEVVQVVI